MARALIMIFAITLMILGTIAVSGVIVHSLYLLIKEFFAEKKFGNIEIIPNSAFDSDRKLIKRFKWYCLLYGSWIFSLYLSFGCLISFFWALDMQQPAFYRLFTGFLILIFLIFSVVILIYLYKVSKLLKLSGNLKVNPSLIIVFTLVLAFFSLAFVPFLIIWIKSNSYLKKKGYNSTVLK